MRAFIIRPFGTKKEIDFDAVEKDLIVPALKLVGVDGRTTLDILRAGNIRVDMFQRLLTADLVVADLSIHNANVFYELGIRHALRDKRTLLLRSESDSYPFDLQTDRYFIYKAESPAESLDPLVKALKQTIISEEQDSPVFRSLPNLRAQERSRFLAVPIQFREEVELAFANKQVGDLELLAAETRGFEWESEGLRVVGRAQFKLKASKGARVTWESIRKFDPNDLEANTLLGTVYERLGDLARSNLALQRVLESRELDKEHRAEARSLIGRNAKTLWRQSWDGRPNGELRPLALRSGHLDDAYKAYADAFEEDLNHFYSGLNALAILTIETQLATELPDVWEERFDETDDARRELEARKKQRERLAAAVGVSLQAALKRLERRGEVDIWAEISEADLSFLTSQRPPRVAKAYQKALAGAEDFAVEAARNQLLIYQKLGILSENVEASLKIFPPSDDAETTTQTTDRKRSRVLLFTGHRIDDPGRVSPRFPPDKEGIARALIQKAIEEESLLPDGIAFGLAGGASGGDILFHEVCSDVSIPTKLYLALPPDQFIKASVQSAGPQWVERFRQLRQQVSERTLAESEELPGWLQEKEEYGLWQRNNLWMLYNALAAGGDNVVLIALWNGKKGDGPGGTGDLVQKAQERGAKVVIIDTQKFWSADEI